MTDSSRRYAPAQDIVLVSKYNIVPEVTKTTDGKDVAFLLMPVTGKVNGQDIEVELRLAFPAVGFQNFMRALRSAYMTVPIENR